MNFETGFFGEGRGFLIKVGLKPALIKDFNNDDSLKKLDRTEQNTKQINAQNGAPTTAKPFVNIFRNWGDSKFT